VTPDIADGLGLKQAAGALVSEPQPGSPAAKAGIESGDVITTVDGRNVADARELARRIGTMAPGTSVSLGVIRHGQEKTVTLTLGTLPGERDAAVHHNEREVPDADMPKLGLQLAPGSNSGDTGNGVVVTAVDPSGVAADHGFQVGDVILDVGGKTVTTPSDVRKQLADARKEGKHTLLFRVKSSEGTHFVALPLVGNA
jgi:serine protease Do